VHKVTQPCVKRVNLLLLNFHYFITLPFLLNNGPMLVCSIILQVWPEAKQVNPNFSVCELGSIIGRRWRELSDADKQPYFDSFTNAKVHCQALFGKYMFNPLECRGKYIATSNDMKLVHWQLMGRLLHLVHGGGDWAGPQPTQAPPRCTKCNSPPINSQCTNHRIDV